MHIEYSLHIGIAGIGQNNCTLFRINTFSCISLKPQSPKHLAFILPLQRLIAHQTFQN
jgi:hypothetical protein